MESAAKIPIACTLSPDSLQQRKNFLLDIIGRAAHREELGSGFQFSFDPSSVTLQELTQAIDLERVCCKFLRFTITVEPAFGPLRLELSGPDGTKQFLQQIAGSRQ